MPEILAPSLHLPEEPPAPGYHLEARRYACILPLEAEMHFLKQTTL